MENLPASNSSIYITTPTPRVSIATTTQSSTLTVLGTIESMSGGFKFPDGSIKISTVTYRVIIEEQYPQNTNGEAIASGDWRTRHINTEVYDNGNNATITTYVSSGTVTLIAGLYYCNWLSMTAETNRNQSRLLNVTSGVVISTGTSAYADSAGSNNPQSTGVSVFALSANSALAIQHKVQATGYGGIAANLTTEIYARLDCIKY